MLITPLPYIHYPITLLPLTLYSLPHYPITPLPYIHYPITLLPRYPIFITPLPYYPITLYSLPITLYSLPHYPIFITLLPRYPISITLLPYYPIFITPLTYIHCPITLLPHYPINHTIINLVLFILSNFIRMFKLDLAKLDVMQLTWTCCTNLRYSLLITHYSHQQTLTWNKEMEILGKAIVWKLRYNVITRVKGCTERDGCWMTLHNTSVNLSSPTRETKSKYYPIKIGKHFEYNHLFRPLPPHFKSLPSEDSDLLLRVWFQRADILKNFGTRYLRSTNVTSPSHVFHVVPRDRRRCRYSVSLSMSILQFICVTSAYIRPSPNLQYRQFWITQSNGLLFA